MAYCCNNLIQLLVYKIANCVGGRQGRRLTATLKEKFAGMVYTEAI